MFSKPLAALIAFAAALIAANASHAAAPASPASCDSRCLTEIKDQYLAALVARDPSKAPLAADVKITENGLPLTFKQGLWASALKNGVQRILAVDPVLEQVGYLGTIEETGGPAEFSLRLKVKDRRIVEVETLVQRDERDLILPTLQIPDPLFQGELPKAERLSRDELARIAKSYFHAIQVADASGVPLHPAAVRNENGEQKHLDPANSKKPTVGQQIDMGLSKAVRVRDQRIIAADETRGVVYMAVFIDYLGGVTKATSKDGRTFDIPQWAQRPHSWISAEGFAIKNGQIRQLEAIFVKVPFDFKSGWPEAPAATAN